jgi:hypothetical protein
MNKNYILDILIPTYNRDMYALRAINSALNKNTKVRVLCNSNEYSHIIDEKFNNKHNFEYTYFSINKGAGENFRFLLAKSTAKFCMLLSDEDLLNELMINDYVDFLENIDSDIGFVSASVWQNKNRLIWSFNENIKLTLPKFLLLGMPLSTYMSGFTFNVDDLRFVQLEQLYKYDIGNAYAHVDTVLKILERNKKITYYNKEFVIKGDDAKVGGDAYSHRCINTDAEFSSKNLNLNPLTYGPEARTKQFFYRNLLLSDLKVNNFFPKKIALLFNSLFFLNQINNVKNVVIIDSNFDIKLVVGSSINESLIKYQKNINFPIRLFMFFNKIKIKFFRRCFLIFLNNLSKIYKKLYYLLFIKKNK